MESCARHAGLLTTSGWRAGFFRARFGSAEMVEQLVTGGVAQEMGAFGAAAMADVPGCG